MKTTVRICSLEIENLKNVRHGIIEMPNRLPGYNPDRGELLGIYGQNGSGKTAVVNAFTLIQRLICGLPLEQETAALITCGEKEATLSVLFSLTRDATEHLMRYSVAIILDEDGARVRRESLTHRVNAPKARTSTIAEFDEPVLPTAPEFSPISTFIGLLNNCSRQEIVIHKVLAYQEKTSYIFSRRIYPLLLTPEREAGHAMQALRCYAERNLFIISQEKSGLVNVNLQPIPISHPGEDCQAVDICLINLNAPSVLPLFLYKEFGQSLMHMNRVICKIIPGFSLQVKEFGRELSAQNEELMRFELQAVRPGMEIPLKYESDGIKKIISLLLYWIIVSNTPGACLIVDELDASIFEYLLGELLSVWEENAQGQLIFTAHNLHPLEMLDKRSVVFTTVDQNQRFIRLKKIKPSNNLRDVYLRSIFIGGQELELYEETSKTEIARAIRKATTEG